MRSFDVREWSPARVALCAATKADPTGVVMHMRAALADAVAHGKGAVLSDGRSPSVVLVLTYAPAPGPDEALQIEARVMTRAEAVRVDAAHALVAEALAAPPPAEQVWVMAALPGLRVLWRESAGDALALSAPGGAA